MGNIMAATPWSGITAARRQQINIIPAKSPYVDLVNGGNIFRIINSSAFDAVIPWATINDPNIMNTASDAYGAKASSLVLRPKITIPTPANNAVTGSGKVSDTHKYIINKKKRIVITPSWVNSDPNVSPRYIVPKIRIPVIILR